MTLPTNLPTKPSKLDLAQDRFELTQAPIAALRFTDGKVTFAAATTDPALDSSKDPASRAVSLLARTPNALYHWWWGWCIHDFTGMVAKDRIQLDFCHDCDEPIGFGDTFSVDFKTGLTVSGRVESISMDPPDEAAKLIARADKGIPFESSIYFQPMVVEYVEGGATADVNGQTVAGPVTIFREWRLRAVAICSHGFDYGSDAEMELGEKADPSTQFSWKGKPMTKEAAKPEADAGELRSQFQSELKRYTDRFGADGSTYFADGLSYEQALEKQLHKINGQLSDEKARADAAEAKIEAAQLSHGEKPIDTGAKGTDGTKGAKSFSALVQPRHAGSSSSK